MSYRIDHTHDETLTSWVASANEGSMFPVQNLPYCCFSTLGSDNCDSRVGVGIGDCVLDLRQLSQTDLLVESLRPAAGHRNLGQLLNLSNADRLLLRHTLSELLSNPASGLATDSTLRQSALISLADVKFHLPSEIGDYTDFYASVYHATNVGSMFRPDNPLLPNYKHIPIGYHGRASSVVPSGTLVRRPQGQLPPAADGASPTFGPSQNLDYELEVGALIARGNELGTPIPIGEAEAHLFGLVLVNDWSARDIQRWEYQPLGPFLAKSFATTISPWVVTLEALAPFRSAAFQRPAGDPQPLEYLRDEADRTSGAFDLTLTVKILTEKMRASGQPPHALSHTSFLNMYWTMAQMLCHHSSNGCNLRPGDLIASGTVSGPERLSRGCLLELTWDGELGSPVPGSQRTPVELPNGERRTFLADGDQITMSGFCSRPGYRTIGFGECSGLVVSAQ